MRRLLFVPFAVLAISCDKVGDPFLPLPELCPQRSAALCSARSRGCTEEEIDPECAIREAERCESLSDEFEAEDGLTYDTVVAFRVRDEEQAALDSGEAPYPLARYFVGGLPDDAECERDSQCESGACNDESGVCEPHAELTLCAPE